MKRTFYPLMGLFLCIATIACQQNKQEDKNPSATAQESASITTDSQHEDPQANFEDDPSLSNHIELIDNFGSLLRNFHAGNADTLTLTLLKPAFVNIDIATAIEGANVRINQVISPIGDIDGPFGRTLEQDFHEAGTYKLVIAESLMQGDSYAGKYRVNIVISEN